jgi:hypothetical protein
MHGLDVTVVDVRDRPMLPEVICDHREHSPLIGVLARCEIRQMLLNVPLNQFLDGWRFARLGLVGGRVLAEIDALSQFLGFVPRSGHRPIREKADLEPALAAVLPVIYEERFGAIRMASGGRKDADPEALAVPQRDRAGRWRPSVLDDVMRQFRGRFIGQRRR